jgi:S1-C subfamily serine protease
MSESGQSETFEPLPISRSPIKARIDAGYDDPDSATPERWFEATATGEAPEGYSAMRQETGADPAQDVPAPGPGRRLVTILVATSLVSALLAAGGTTLAMNGAGLLNPTAPPATAAARVIVESNTSTIIAAVNKVNRAVVQILANDGNGNSEVGAGIIFDVRGWVLTNKHVVAGMKSLTVRLVDDRRVAASIYGLDTLSDLAVVKLQGATDIWSVDLGDSSNLQVGELAIAIGSPLGLGYPNSVSSGIVSALGRDVAVPGNAAGSSGTGLHGLIQTDAAINPGNSGGPLVDADGMVIGITTAQASSAEGIGFAIPIDIAKPIMQQALAGEPLARPYMGVSYLVIDKGLQESNNLALEHGAWVHKEDAAGSTVPAVTPNSPAAAAGVKDGDIITSMEGVQIDGLHRLEDVLVRYTPGRNVTVQVYRGGTYITLHITLGTRPDNLG